MQVRVSKGADYRYIPRQRFAALPWYECESVKPILTRPTGSLVMGSPAAVIAMTCIIRSAGELTALFTPIQDLTEMEMSPNSCTDATTLAAFSSRDLAKVAFRF